MSQRLRSLDVLRGATVALMILVNNPGSWAHLYPPLAHAAWHGCTPTDLVFPFFLFAVGNALAQVMPGLQQAGRAAFGAKLARRALIIFGLGLLLNSFPFVRWDLAGDLVWRDFGQWRFMGVLQRIALCWAVAALVVWLWGRRGALVSIAVLLIGYVAACVALGDPADPWSLAGWFGTALDKAVLGTSHLYRGEGVPFDPEGLASTPPAVAQVLIGWWVGEQLRQADASAPDRHAVQKAGARVAVPQGDPRSRPAVLRRLVTFAVLMGVAAYAVALVVPINKKIWTPSYVLLTSALAMATLAALVAWIDVAGVRSRFAQGAVALCEAFGRNALFVFVLSGLVPRALALFRWPDGVDANGLPHHLTPLPWLYRTVFADLAPDPRAGSLLFAITQVALYGALVLWMHRRRIYIKV